MKGDVKLKHCVVKDIIHEVSDFAHLSPNQRPESFCPECDSQLILKLSNSSSPNSKVHHAAHKNENLSCSLSSPEGVLHFNTKGYIYEQLKLGNKLFIKQECAGSDLAGINKKRWCWNDSQSFLWLENWDDVQLERNVQSLRPDIVFYRNNQPIGALEVCVTNAVSDEKQEKLRELGLPWVEVKADGDIIDEYFVNWFVEDEDDEFPWKIEKPLIYDKCFPVPEDWVCERCQRAPEFLKELEERQAMREAEIQSEKLRQISDEREKERKKLRYFQAQDNHIIKAKALFFLKPLGEKELIELFVIQRHNADLPTKVEEIYLKLGRYAGKILISEEPITADSKRIIFEFFKDWYRLQKRLNQMVYDVTDWVEISEFEKLLSNSKLPYEWKRLQGWVEIQ